MVIFGAIDFSAEMAKLASEVGYQVTICDARRPFADSPRFSRVAEVVVDWPDRYLESPELGPRDGRRLHPRREVRRARADLVHWPPTPATSARSAAAAPRRGGSSACATPASTSRPSPGSMRRAGLDVSARTPVETAVSILAEVIAVRTAARREFRARAARSTPARRRPAHRPASPAPSDRYDRFRLVSLSLPIRAVLVALVCLVALPRIRERAPRQPHLREAQRDDPARRLCRHAAPALRYGPIAITPGQNNIEAQIRQEQADGARLHHALQAQPRLLGHEEGPARRRDPPPPRRLAGTRLPDVRRGRGEDHHPAPARLRVSLRPARPLDHELHDPRPAS